MMRTITEPKTLTDGDVTEPHRCCSHRPSQMLFSQNLTDAVLTDPHRWCSNRPSQMLFSQTLTDGVLTEPDAVLVAELVWVVLGVVWLSRHYQTCTSQAAKDAILGIVVCNWCVMVSVVLTVWCTFDAAGRSWVKMKRYQRSMRDSHTRFQYRRSGNRNRNWRQRKVLRAYQDSWDHRCRLLFCCMGKSDDTRNSFSDIARLLSEFFRDLDVVPSDVVAGLVLLRKYQKLNRQEIVKSNKNDVYEFLSGVPITPR
ncbi:diacylglycerol lipase-alpha-like [Homarus americanus]|uniref:diacylglycerol lipase-alpha-like n=1 Tax=Homarus americanus TaxID=6706 RepID=UPI001C48B88B|nr:diacylglycerol lipase-alpha-like [Homarus americanus]